MTIRRAWLAEGLGTLLLLATVVGSGIMGQRLSPGNPAIALLANAIATGGVLYALIAGLGAHMNPLVTLIEAVQGRLPRERVAGYLAAQVIGAYLGVLLAHAMFGEPLFQVSQHARGSVGEIIGEVVATFGLWLTIATTRHRPTHAAAVALYIVGAYWFTSSTSFANPAVTIARAFTETFAGIRPADLMHFIPAQLAGAALAALAIAWIFQREPRSGQS